LRVASKRYDACSRACSGSLPTSERTDHHPLAAKFARLCVAIRVDIDLSALDVGARIGDYKIADEAMPVAYARSCTQRRYIGISRRRTLT